MKLKLVKKEQVFPDCITFIFESEEEINWQAGQFLRYLLPEEGMDERGNSRFFTIASAPFEKHIQITTRLAKERGSSFKAKLQNLEIGSEIEASGPSGSFILDEAEKEYVFIAGGIGITPFRSILLDLNHHQKLINITLLYANRDQNIVFQEELESLLEKNPNFQIHYAIDPQRIDEQFINAKINNLNSKIFYLSGPKPMVMGVEETLEKLGVSKDHIKTDYFPGYDQV